MRAMKAGGITIAQAMDYGQRLRSAREDAGLAVDQVAQRLRIRRSLVLAIEAGLVSELPKTPYIDGHWKAYAELVAIRLPPWDKARDAIAGSPAGGPPAEPVPPSPAAPLRPTEKLRVAPPAPRVKSRMPAPLILGGLAVVSGVAWLLYGQTASEPGPRAQASLAPAPPAIAPAPVPVAAEQPGGLPAERPSPAVIAAAPVPDIAAPPAAPAPDREPPPTPAARPEAAREAAPRALSFVARADVWIHLTIPASRRTVLARTLRAADSVALPLEPGMVLTIGSPGNVDMLLDGRELPLGGFIRQGVIRQTRVDDIIAREQ